MTAARGDSASLREKEVDLEARGDPLVVEGAAEERERQIDAACPSETIEVSRHSHSADSSSQASQDAHSIGASKDGEKEASNEAANDSNIIGWDGPNDPTNPRNFARRRKWLITALGGLYALMTPLSSSMIAPCIPNMSADLSVTSPLKQNLMVSIYMAGYIVGPLVYGPVSEVVGRKYVITVANVTFIVFNILCARASSFSEMSAFRILAGVGGAGPLSVCGGALSDLWEPIDRGKAVALFSLGPLLGPAIGPIVGGFLSEKRIVAGQQSWRWVFYLTTLVAIFPCVLGWFYFRETYAPVLLKRKTQRLQRETGNMKLRSIHHKDETVVQLIERGLIRPFVMLFTQPIVAVLAVYSAVLFGTYYILLITFTETFITAYHESSGIASLNYIALAFGFLSGRLIGTRVMDVWYRKLKARNGGVGQPEMRIILLAAPCFLIPIGLLVYGWTIQYHVHWIVPDIGAFLFGAGLMQVTFVVQTYTLDAYPMYGASALAATTSLRSVAAFSFPLFASKMYDVLGHGWGNTILALVAFFVGGPGALLLYYRGPRLRELSPYAAGEKY